MGLNEMLAADLEEVPMIEGRYLATVGELTASGDYMDGTIRCVHWGDPHGYTVEKLVVSGNGIEGRVEDWVHMGQAWYEGTALLVMEMVVAKEMS